FESPVSRREQKPIRADAAVAKPHRFLQLLNSRLPLLIAMEDDPQVTVPSRVARPETNCFAKLLLGILYFSLVHQYAADASVRLAKIRLGANRLAKVNKRVGCLPLLEKQFSQIHVSLGMGWPKSQSRLVFAFRFGEIILHLKRETQEVMNRCRRIVEAESHAQFALRLGRFPLVDEDSAQGGVR